MLMGQVTDSGGKPVLVLSLTEEDVERMKAGQPVYCHTEVLPLLPDVDVAVTYGAGREEASVAIAAAVPAGHHIRRMASPVYAPPVPEA
ncbi:hypothetical protein [Streptomyces violaceusniger]|uniref:Uncharacterized protein n=1 Tax=Streptomyces violaceusniger (strain Tu 4113) TaxID=653045 RepID=G2PHI5_STRV4|nr:hypothetical protein [Streptomyces violaceusniger]AEM88988.1 hypothetical protein Strvi_0215 [Streptomyces violaceusniger Tu 4113]